MTIKIFDPAHPNGVAYRSFAEAGLTKFVNDYSMHFASGSSALVNAGNRAAFEYTDAFSITGWLWLDAGTTDGTILARMGVDRGLKLYLSSSYLTLDLIHSAGDQLSGYAPTRVWDEGGFYFFGVTYDGSNAASTGLKFYLTGALDGCTVNDESVSGSIVESNVDLIIGYGFDGYLDELGIWRGAHTLTEIENLYITQIPKHLGRYASPASSRLVHYFRMGDSYLAPGLIIDEVTGGYATIVNATRETDVPEPFTPDPSPYLLPSPVVYCKMDDGPWPPAGTLLNTISAGPFAFLTLAPVGITTPMVNGGSSASFAMGRFKAGGVPPCPGGFAVQTWIRQNPVDNPAPVNMLELSESGGGGGFLLLIAITSGMLMLSVHGGGYAPVAPLSPSPAKNHVLFTYNALTSTITAYVNNVAIPVAWSPPAIPYSGGIAVVYIGASGGGPPFYVGDLDDMAVWSGNVITPVEVAYIWNGGAGNPLI